MKKIIKIFLFFISLCPVFAFASNMTNPYYYAWSNNVGYINFASTTVTSTGLSGSAWSKNAGLIVFTSTGGKVNVANDGSGHLSGSAWGQNLGWISFNNVTIDTSTGKFSGQATGTSVGIINFNCSTNPSYCDVRTDWRPAVTPSTPSTPSSGGGGGGGGGGMVYNYCTTVVYGDWFSCSGGTQTRVATSRYPSGCSLTADQISSTTRSCGVATSTGATTTPIIVTDGKFNASSDNYKTWNKNIVNMADIIQDGVIDLFDFNAVMVDWGKLPANLINKTSDVNGDGVVDLLDFNLVMVYWGKIFDSSYHY